MDAHSKGAITSTTSNEKIITYNEELDSASDLKLSKDIKQSAGGFYHKADVVIEAKMANRTTPATVIGLLKNNGVKEDEIKWSNIEKVLQDLTSKDGKVSKRVSSF